MKVRPGDSEWERHCPRISVVAPIEATARKSATAAAELSTGCLPSYSGLWVGQSAEDSYIPPRRRCAYLHKRATFCSGPKASDQDNTLMPDSTRTLRLKVRPQCHGWLDAATIEVNRVYNYCNEISYLTATRTDRKRKWLSGFDLCSLTAGASAYFERIGADTIQRICTEYAQKRATAKRCKL